RIGHLGRGLYQHARPPGVGVAIDEVRAVAGQVDEPDRARYLHRIGQAFERFRADAGTAGQQQPIERAFAPLVETHAYAGTRVSNFHGAHGYTGTSQFNALTNSMNARSLPGIWARFG